MDLARDEETRVRNLGRLALEKAAKAGASKAGSNGISRTFATVSRVNGDGTIDVSMGDYTDVNGVTSECILRGLRMTVACSSAQVGDRVIVDTYAHVSVVTGILANADNAHYVNRIATLWSGLVQPQGTITLDASWKNYCIFGAFYHDWKTALICWHSPVMKKMEFIGGADDGSSHEYYLATFEHVSENTFHYLGGNAHPAATTTFNTPVKLPITNIYGLV